MDKEVKLVVHMADIHLRTFRMHEEYGEVFKTTLKRIRNLVKDYDREEIRIVIAGDYVHQKITISNELLILGTWFLRKLEAIAPVVMIAGNHDLLENNKDRIDSLTPMVKLLPGLNINYYTGESSCYLDNNIVWCVYSIFDENNRPDIEKARAEFGDDKTYIGLYHAPVLGARTDIGYEFDHGMSFEHFEGCDMVMMGDIHKRALFLHKQNMFIDENELETYKKMGWDVDND